MESAFQEGNPHLNALPEGAADARMGRLVPSGGKNCDINFPSKWKVVSTPAGSPVSVRGRFMGIYPDSAESFSAFQLLSMM
jgi:hypothetical protein